jgi:hypothetical protein
MGENIKNTDDKEIKSNIIVKDDIKVKEKLKAEDNKVESKFEICEIKYIKNNKVAVLFKGFGILIDLGNDVKLNSNGKTIKVYYSSDIGRSDFKYWIEE